MPMKKNSTLETPLSGSVKVSMPMKARQPRPLTIIKLKQPARCAFSAGSALPIIVMN